MPPKTKKPANGASKKSNKVDPDMEFLKEQQKIVAQTSQKMKQEKEAADKIKAQKKLDDDKRQQEADKENATKAQQLPPIFVDDVAKEVVVMKGGVSAHMRDMSWLSYTINNFLSFVLESHRRLYMRTPAEPENGEPVISYTVHDISEDDNAPHSWNLVTVASGVYAIDCTLKQFDAPGGRYGFRRDTAPEEGWVPVKGLSRLIPLSAPTDEGAANANIHKGFPAKDGGILPIDGTPIMSKEGVPVGTTKKYHSFLSDANAGRFHHMSAAEQRTAKILHNQKSAPAFRDIHDRLEKKLFVQ
eukprot:Tbor_TRINITY_DN5500_c6_g3::TRINITY_DN5500_c6_g3_i1::g.12842::m.12842